MDVGIARITITDEIKGRGAYRFKDARARQPAANKLYRKSFASMGMPLKPGDTDIRVGKDEFEAGYDYALGIDVILTFDNGQEATLQEKFLLTRFRTVTVEHMQDPTRGEQGDWFTMKCDYYFVGYDRANANSFQEWILLNWPMVRQQTNMGNIPWRERRNKRDGARASFKHVDFSGIPMECIVSAVWDYKGKDIASDLSYRRHTGLCPVCRMRRAVRSTCGSEACVSLWTINHVPKYYQG